MRTALAFVIACCSRGQWRMRGPEQQKVHREDGRQCRMKQPQMRARLWGSLFGSLLLSLCLVPTAWAQRTLGSVSVTVVDPSGGAVPGASLTLTDVATNDARTATTQDGGHLHLCEPQFRPAQADRVPGRLHDADLRRAGAVRSHHGREGHVEGRRDDRGRRGVGRRPRWSRPRPTRSTRPST